jgi:hypothetical protein
MLTGEGVSRYPAILYRDIFLPWPFGPVNQASPCRMIGWLIVDVTGFMQFTDALMISRYRRDPAIGHERFPVNGKRTLESAPLPANEQASEQAHMGSQHPAVGAHAPDPPTIVGGFLVDCCRCHCWPPSNNLVMSSNL